MYLPADTSQVFTAEWEVGCLMKDTYWTRVQQSQSRCLALITKHAPILCVDPSAGGTQGNSTAHQCLLMTLHSTWFLSNQPPTRYCLIMLISVDWRWCFCLSQCIRSHNTWFICCIMNRCELRKANTEDLADRRSSVAENPPMMHFPFLSQQSATSYRMANIICHHTQGGQQTDTSKSISLLKSVQTQDLRGLMPSWKEVNVEERGLFNC